MKITDRLRMWVGKTKREAVEVIRPQDAPTFQMHCGNCGNTDPNDWSKCKGPTCPIMESPFHISKMRP